MEIMLLRWEFMGSEKPPMLPLPPSAAAADAVAIVVAADQMSL